MLRAQNYPIFEILAWEVLLMVTWQVSGLGRNQFLV